MKNAKDLFMYALGAIITMGIFTILALLVYQEIPEGNRDLMNLVVGSLLTSFAMVVGYFYGSSKGSADKSEMIDSTRKEEIKKEIKSEK